ncbi:MAG: hypothetical protein ACRELA_08525 [Candidatus Rokuibacteriota bacterium]
MPSTTLRTLLRVLALGVVAGFLLIREGAYGGGMGASYMTCQCLGVEWELYDSRPVDGPRKTICVGIVQSRTCYRSSGGPLVECRTE